jgi:hypothetical protein
MNADAGSYDRADVVPAGIPVTRDDDQLTDRGTVTPIDDLCDDHATRRMDLLSLFALAWAFEARVASPRGPPADHSRGTA